MKYALFLLAAAAAFTTGCTTVKTTDHDRPAAVSTSTTTSTHEVHSAPVGATTSSTTVRSY